jgi:hypothetical protein
MNLVVGGGRLDRELEDVKDLVQGYLTDDGLRYLDYEPSTPSDRLLPDDLTVTILINSRVAARAFKAVQDHGQELRLNTLPGVALQETNSQHRDDLASVIAQVASWPGFAASVATKVLHKKRPELIPILDNEAIFGACMNPNWPEQRASTESVYAATQIREALEWIWHDLNRDENSAVWPVLSEQHRRERGSSCSTWRGGSTSEGSSRSRGRCETAGEQSGDRWPRPRTARASGSSRQAAQHLGLLSRFDGLVAVGAADTTERSSRGEALEDEETGQRRARPSVPARTADLHAPTPCRLLQNPSQGSHESPVVSWKSLVGPWVDHDLRPPATNERRPEPGRGQERRRCPCPIEIEADVRPVHIDLPAVRPVEPGRGEHCDPIAEIYPLPPVTTCREERTLERGPGPS